MLLTLLLLQCFCSKYKPTSGVVFAGSHGRGGRDGGRGGRGGRGGGRDGRGGGHGRHGNSNKGTARKSDFERFG